MSARDPLQELEEALSFPASPDFCARVRHRVAVEPLRSRMWFGHGLAVAAAVVLATGIGVMTTLRYLDVEVAQVSRPGVTNATPLPAEPGPTAVAAIGPVPVYRRSASVAASETVSPYETVVPDDQLHALDRLLAAMRAGRAAVPPAVADSELNDRGERVLRALIIEPVTVELLAGTPAEPIKNPVKDPNK